MVKANNTLIRVLLFGDNKAPEKFSYLDQKSPDYSEIFSDNNYQRIFIERNDSVYRHYYNAFFVNDPGQSFLLACAYYMLGENNSKDFEPVFLELKGRFGAAPVIKLKRSK